MIEMTATGRDGRWGGDRNMFGGVSGGCKCVCMLMGQGVNNSSIRGGLGVKLNLGPKMCHLER